MEKAQWVQKLVRINNVTFLCVQETQMSNLDDSFLGRFWGNFEANSVSVNARGRSGGLFSIWNPKTFVKTGVICDDSFILVSGSMAGSGNLVNVVNVYAPRDVSERRSLWNRLLAIRSQHPGLWVIIGDFNEVRYLEDRLHSKFDNRGAFLFNEFIRDAGLNEYRMGGCDFTYMPYNGSSMSKIDRVLVCEDFMCLWPYAKCIALNRYLSDHSPILLSCSTLDFGPPPFRFYNSWLDIPGIEDVVNNTVGLQQLNSDEFGFLRDLLKSLKSNIKEWRSKGKQEEEKILKSTLDEIEAIDVKAKFVGLNDTEKERRVMCNLRIRNFEKNRVADLQQKARYNWAKLGDENSHFFHKVVNLRKASNRIHSLVVDGVEYSDPNLIKKKLKAAFKRQFSEPKRVRPVLALHGFRKLSSTEAKSVVSRFSKEEIKKAVWDCGGDKAPGPDGFTFKFVKKFWSFFEQYFFKIFQQFYSKPRITYGCNSSFIALIPKNRDPKEASDFRPISLIGMLYKVIAKVLANRLKPVLSTVVSPVQSGFIEGRSILDGPLILSEVLSWAKITKKQILVFKVDFQKAYDSVNWNFLLDILNGMNFPTLWRNWIKACLKSGRSSVLVNGSPTTEFQLYRGLRQGDPMSPFLFVLMLEALNILMNRAVDVGVFKGVVLPNGGPTLSHLFYADDVIFIGEWSEENIKNLNRILRCFNLCSGLKVNLNKSCVYGVGVEEEENQNMANLIHCKAGMFPCTFLGLPIGANMKRVKYWKPIIDKFNAKLSGWKAKSLSLAGRVTLAKAVLGALPNYYLSIFKAPIGVINMLEKIRKNFVWGNKGGGKSIKWIAWDKMVAPKRHGGLGVGDIRSLNLSLLAKWWWKLKTNHNALWVRVVVAIHGNKKEVQAFPFNKRIAGIWKDIGAVEKDFSKMNLSLSNNLKGIPGSGDDIYFWHDLWIGDRPLKDQFKHLYLITHNKEAKIKDHMEVGHQLRWKWEWAHDPTDGVEKQQFDILVQALNGISVRGERDIWRWKGYENEELTVGGLRQKIYEVTKPNDGELWSWWNNWVPPKVNLFAWRATLNRIPSKVNLIHRGVIMGDDKCVRCGLRPETVEHILWDCWIAKSIWWTIMVWLKLPFPVGDCSLSQLLGTTKDMKGSKEWKKIIGAVLMVAAWEIWKTRNDNTFNNHHTHFNRTAELIKENSYLWITSRSKFSNIDWSRWSDFNIRDVIV
ncbi:putative RNA-directed DNA polymerase [Helianthus annuus]|nr:putative RNA-directed DNA polymerase [Helianthus annuus]KAJ0543445.1 putative RNA-directed DNA polymerase [Helianthus annuus]KAJ0708492.1 putative RNA-directed DNA polymerase [Helianthus annuus]